jgi:hypothetical protein
MLAEKLARKGVASETPHPDHRPRSSPR